MEVKTAEEALKYLRIAAENTVGNWNDHRVLQESLEIFQSTIDQEKFLVNKVMDLKGKLKAAEDTVKDLETKTKRKPKNDTTQRKSKR